MTKQELFEPVSVPKEQPDAVWYDPQQGVAGYCKISAEAWKILKPA